MDTTIEQQVAIDEALVPHAQRCPFFKAFLVTTDVPEIYMQEFWAIATVHHHAIRFKMDNKKHIVNLESFRDMLHIFPRVPDQSFDEPPFEEVILAFIRSFRHSVAIRTLTDEKQGELALCQGWLIDIDLYPGKAYPGRSSDRGCTEIQLELKHQNTQQFGALLPIELTNDEIRNFKAYKEYYAIATGEASPKPKASVRRTKSSSDTSITPPTTAASTRLTASAKGKQTTKASKAKSLSALSENSTDDEGDDNEEKDDDGDEEDEGDDGEEGNHNDDEDDDGDEGGGDEHEYDEEESDEETRDEESFDPFLKTPKNSEDKGDDEEDLSLNVGEEERHVEEEEEDELYRDVNINQGKGIQATLEVEDSHVTLTLVNPDGMESIFKTTSQIDVQTPTSMAPLPITAPTMNSSTIATTTTTSQAQILPTTAPSTIIQNLLNFSSLFSFDNRLRTLEANFSEVMQTNQFAGASDQLRDEAQRENDEFLRTVDENIKKIIKEQVKEQVKVQVSKILPRIEQAVNEQLEAEVLTRSSHSSRTSYAVADDLFEMELKKILIEKMKGNKEDAMTMLTRMKNSPLDQTGGQREAEKEMSLSQQALHRKQLAGALAGVDDQPIVQSSQHPEWFYQQQKPPTLDRDWNKTLPTVHESIQPWITELAKQDDSRSYFNELMGTPLDFSNFLMNRLRVDTDDDKLYKFKEGDFKRLRIQDIKDMFLLFVQGKLTNLTVEERFAFNVSLRMFTKSIVIQRRMEDLQPGVKSYQKKLNLTKPDTYRSDLKRKEAYTAYSNPRGFIYQNKDKKNRLMRIDELHKFSDGTLTDVLTALDDRLKGIRMRYLPQTIWRKSDKDRAAAMIQDIDKRLKTRRIMMRLERFVGGRLYEGDFRMLQRTI
nr:hypothetical protein [Tanacetum cinerariifolium]